MDNQTDGRTTNNRRSKKLNWAFSSGELKTEFPLPLLSLKDALCQVWLKLAQWFWGKKIFFFILSMSFRYFLIVSPLKRARSFIWTNLNPLHPRMHAQWFWRRRFFFLIEFVNVFRYFVIISPWKRTGPFTRTNLNPLHPRMLCAKFGWNWPSGSEEEDENVKSLRQQQRRRRKRRTTDKWSEKLTWAFGSGELIRSFDPLP